MSDRIDHAAEASRLLANADRMVSNDWPLETGEFKTDILAAAQVHATLALVEQQRVANLIALAGSRNPILREQVAEDAAEALATFHEHADLALGGWHEVRPDIAAALGIETGAGDE